MNVCTGMIHVCFRHPPPPTKPRPIGWFKCQMITPHRNPNVHADQSLSVKMKPTQSRTRSSLCVADLRQGRTIVNVSFVQNHELHIVPSHSMENQSIEKESFSWKVFCFRQFWGGNGGGSCSHAWIHLMEDIILKHSANWKAPVSRREMCRRGNRRRKWCVFALVHVHWDDRAKLEESLLKTLNVFHHHIPWRFQTTLESFLTFTGNVWLSTDYSCFGPEFKISESSNFTLLFGQTRFLTNV